MQALCIAWQVPIPPTVGALDQVGLALVGGLFSPVPTTLLCRPLPLLGRALLPLQLGRGDLEVLPLFFCGELGQGHPDPDIMFAEGKFYLATQMKTDYVSPGPWVEDVEVRVGVDTDNDGKIDHWSEGQKVKEEYDYIKGFSKQIKKIPASMDLSKLPAGYGFQFEVKLTDSTENSSKPILDSITLRFKN